MIDLRWAFHHSVFTEVSLSVRIFFLYGRAAVLAFEVGAGVCGEKVSDELFRRNCVM